MFCEWLWDFFFFFMCVCMHIWAGVIICMKTSLVFPSTTFPLWDRIFHWPGAQQRSQRSSSLHHLSSTMTTTATPQFCLLIHWRMYKFILCLVLCKYYTTHESAGTSSKCTNFTSFVFMLRIGITVSSIYLFLNFFSFKMLIVYIYCTKGHFHINTCYLFKFFWGASILFSTMC